MITAEDFVFEIENNKESKNFKLGTVAALFVNKTAKIKFDGEDIASEKQYAYLESYAPKVSDRVLLAVTGGTYVILGKVNYNVSPPTEDPVEELDRYLFDQKIVNMTKGLSVTGNVLLNNNLNVGGTSTFTGLASLNGGASISGSLGISGDVNAVNLSATGKVTASGNVQGASLTINGAASVYDFHHRGSYISFFNKFQNTARQNISWVSATDATSLYNKINEILQALKLYGLIG